MKSKITRYLCIIVSLFIIVSLSSTPVFASASINNINENKIDSLLKEKLEQLADDDEISVSVWFKDIDKDTLKK